jgi:pSer/pThr/pTyr-binding forkhead associated (FHA) protein
VVVVLYLFLLEVVRSAWRELGPVPERAGRRLRAKLEILQPAAARRAAGNVIPLRGSTTIGREPDNDLVVDEETVSNRHARLLPRDGRWWIEDLGSRNGTLVNNDQVEGSRVLRAGDVIQVGRVQLRFSG